MTRAECRRGREDKLPQPHRAIVMTTLRIRFLLLAAASASFGSASFATLLGAQPPAARDTTPPLTSSPLPTGRVTYRTLTETNLELEQLAARHPDRVRRFALPHKTVLGQTVWALEVARNGTTPDGSALFRVAPTPYNP